MQVTCARKASPEKILLQSTQQRSQQSRREGRWRRGPRPGPGYCQGHVDFGGSDRAAEKGAGGEGEGQALMGSDGGAGVPYHTVLYDMIPGTVCCRILVVLVLHHCTVRNVNIVVVVVMASRGLPVMRITLRSHAPRGGAPCPL